MCCGYFAFFLFLRVIFRVRFPKQGWRVLYGMVWHGMVWYVIPFRLSYRTSSMPLGCVPITLGRSCGSRYVFPSLSKALFSSVQAK